MISLINDYSLFGATDDETIEKLFIKLGKENKRKYQKLFTTT
jgi:hypothetical protein